MTGGTEFQEAVEAPQEKLEVSESRAELNKATFEAPSKIEEGNIQVAENVQQAFVAVVEAAGGAAGADGRPEMEEREVKAAEAVANGGPQTEDRAARADFAKEPEGATRDGTAIDITGSTELNQEATQPEIVETRNGVIDDFQAVEDTKTESAQEPSASDSGVPTGKEALGQPAPDPSHTYSGVEMAQGEVQEDNDLNNPPPGEAADLNPTEMEDPPAYDPDLIPEKTGTDQSIDFRNTIQTSQSVVSSGVDLRSTDDVVNEMENQLNTIGDDAELADIDLQSALDKQQETIDMLTTMGEVQRDTAETVVRKIALGQTSAGDTTDTGETGEGGENKIVIAAGTGQIDFSEIVGEVSKIDHFIASLDVAKDEVGDFRVPTLHPTQIDPLPERTASGDYLETPADVADLNLTEKQDPPAYDTDLKPEKAGESQPESSDQESSIRQEISNLQDELDDWQEGETREITFNTWEKGEDGTMVKVEKTVTLTKEEAEDLLDTMEDRLSKDESRGGTESSDSIYQLNEGILVVGEAPVAELPLDLSDLMEDLVLDGEEIGETQEEVVETSDDQDDVDESDELRENYQQTINSINQQITSLQQIYQSLNGEPITLVVNLFFAEKQSDGTYTMVHQTTQVSYSSIPSLINMMLEKIYLINMELEDLEYSSSPIPPSTPSTPGGDENDGGSINLDSDPIDDADGTSGFSTQSSGSGATSAQSD